MNQYLRPARLLRRVLARGGRRGARTIVIGEFDPGSGRTLAACLMYASRAEFIPSGVSSAANG